MTTPVSAHEACQLAARYAIPPTTAHRVLSMVSDAVERGWKPAAVLPHMLASRLIGDPRKAEAVLRAAAELLGLGYTTGREV